MGGLGEGLEQKRGHYYPTVMELRLYFKNRDNRISAHKRIKLDPSLIFYRKSNSKRIIDLTVRAKAIKLLKENTGIELHDLGSVNTFLDVTQEAQVTKKKVDGWKVLRI